MDIIEELNFHGEDDGSEIFLKAIIEIRKLRIDLAGKDAIIAELNKDIEFYKRNWNE